MFPSDTEEPSAPIVPAGWHLAPFWRRAIGLLVDTVVTWAPVFAVFYALGYTPGEAVADGRAVWLSVGITLVGLLHETLFVWRWGRTAGKFATGTRVVSVLDGGALSLTRSFQRSLVTTTLGAIPQVGVLIGVGVYVWAFFDPMRQGVHDKAAGSIVVLNHRAA